MQAQITEWSAALMTSLTAAMGLFFSALPKILGFAIILIAGWIVASLVARAISSLLKAIQFNGFAQRSGFSTFVQRMGSDINPAELIGAVAKWFVRLLTLVVAFDALNLPAVSDVLRQLVLWLPNVVVALVVLVIAGLAANALSNVVRGTATEAGIEKPELLAKIAAGLVWGFGIVVAVGQIGIATTVVNALFIAVVGSVGLALGLAFGLGGRDTASQIVRNWYGRTRQNSQSVESLAQASARITGQNSVESLVDRRKSERRAG